MRKIEQTRRSRGRHDTACQSNEMETAFCLRGSFVKEAAVEVDFGVLVSAHLTMHDVVPEDSILVRGRPSHSRHPFEPSPRIATWNLVARVGESLVALAFTSPSSRNRHVRVSHFRFFLVILQPELATSCFPTAYVASKQCLRRPSHPWKRPHILEHTGGSFVLPHSV